MPRLTLTALCIGAMILAACGSDEPLENPAATVPADAKHLIAERTDVVEVECSQERGFIESIFDDEYQAIDLAALPKEARVIRLQDDLILDLFRFEGGWFLFDRNRGGPLPGQATDLRRVTGEVAVDTRRQTRRIQGSSHFCGQIEWGPKHLPLVGRSIVVQGTECRPARELVRRVHGCVIRNLNCSPPGFRCSNDSQATQTLRMRCYGLRTRDGITSRISRVDWTWYGF